MRGMGDFVGVESRAAGSRGVSVAAARAERAAERQKAERRAKAFCHRAAVNGVEGGVPEEGDRVAFEWKMDEGELRRPGRGLVSPVWSPPDADPTGTPPALWAGEPSDRRGGSGRARGRTSLAPGGWRGGSWKVEGAVCGGVVD